MKSGKILRADEGNMYWLAGSHLNFKVGKADTEGTFSMASNWVAPGGGPPPHVHRTEDEIFYVLEGEMMVMQGKKTFVGGPGAVAFLRRGEVHTFQVLGKGPAQFLALAIPGNFEAFAAEAGEPIDRIPSDKQVTPAVIAKMLQVVAKHDMEIMREHRPDGEGAGPGKGVARWVMGELVTVKLGSAETDGKFCVAEVVSRPGGEVPSHLHKAMDELFYVIEGEYEFVVEGKATRVGAGGTVYVPRGVRHGFKNVGTGKARLADFHTPGGFEKFFEECGVVCEDPGRPVMRVPEGTEMGRLFERHGMVMG